MFSGSLMLKESPELADIRTETLRGLLSVTAYCTALALHKKHEGYKTFLGSAQRIIHWSVLHACCPGGPVCGQWAAKRPWMLQYGGAILGIPENSPLLDAVKYVIKSFKWVVGLTQLSVVGKVCRWVCTIESYKQSI
jgi:hypothetical protein